MEKPWLKHYSPGVPPELDLDPQRSLVDLFGEACRAFGDRPAFTNMGRTLSFAELEEQSRRFAAWLQGLPDVSTGDRVAIMLPNLLQYPVVLFGAWRAGLVVVNVNPLYTPHELGFQLADSGAKLLVIAKHRADAFEEVAADTDVRHVLVTGIGDLLGFPRGPLVNFAVRWIRRMGGAYRLPRAVGWRHAMATSPSAFTPPAGIDGSTLACLQYTGGTTGRSKGAMLTHGNLVANVEQINAWFHMKQVPGRETVITPLPLYHVYALTCNCLAYVALGGHDILITDPRDTKGLIREMARRRFSAMTGVNTLYQSLVDHPDLPQVDFSSLKLVSAGGMAVAAATAKRWADITGTTIHEGYGLSETSPVVTSNPAELREYNGSIGLPLPGTDVRLLDDDGHDVPAGEPGELCVRGPQLMKGYWNDPESTAASMTADGYFRTGDVATMDADGYFRIVDRKKDMIAVSGLKVYPTEVEGALLGHPGVREAACIGVPDERTGEAVKVFIVRRSGASLDADGVRNFLRGELAPYKVPKHVEFRDELPKSNVGKILRRELRDD